MQNNRCKNCTCALNQAAGDDHILHVGSADCGVQVPTMEFSGFGKAYVPQQRLCKIYQATTGFVRGTIFPELDLPYNKEGDE
ncbi:MAG: spore coat associated protein CotJA [Defluviitaleaceae bacterium]|nr:spore coat associated protein CotJA [Defluviitaleaceae bacterium]